ncbi:AB-hydrolase YheT, partial [Dendrothele bispora CBS 962.96]
FSFFTSPSSPEVYYPLKPADVLLKKRGDNQGKSPFTERKDKKSLRSILEEQCPSLFEGYCTPWWLSKYFCINRTVFTPKARRFVHSRTYLRLVDGGTLGLDFTPVEQSSLPEETPIIVVTHGLTGGSHEGYVRAVLGRASTPVEWGGLGYRAVVVNSRGCAGVPITSQQLYSAGYTDDLRIALIAEPLVMYISHQYPNAPLLGLGFSLGANIMVRYLAEEGEKSRLSAVCSLACPWDMLKNGHAINSTFLGRNLYARGMGMSFYKLLKRNAAVLSGKTVVSPPSLAIAEAVSTTLKLRFPGLDDFDDAFTRIAGGVPQDLNFSSYQEYYAWASSHHVLKDVRRPLLAINAADDPVIRFVPKTEQEVGNPWTTVVVTPGGGHLGWFSPAPSSHKYSMTAGLMETSRWTTKPVLEWLDMAGNDFDIKVNASDLYICDEGFLREFGRTALGCMEVEGGGIIDWS